MIFQDGEWEAPLVPNPACELVGCGEWTPPLIDNPLYRGKWIPPLIDNPYYQGKEVNYTQGCLSLSIIGYHCFFLLFLNRDLEASSN
jgi:hypothetical protein